MSKPLGITNLPVQNCGEEQNQWTTGKYKKNQHGFCKDKSCFTNLYTIQVISKRFLIFQKAFGDGFCQSYEIRGGPE